MGLKYREARELFETIFNKGVQWDMVEQDDLFKSLDEIDMYEDWIEYGNYQDLAAKIFNGKNVGWKIVRIFSDDNWIEHVVDYFSDQCDYDEYFIDIRKDDEVE
ncbi:MAG: hypothetical protein ACTSU2_17550 [Promethearchaeota archaeon]